MALFRYKAVDRSGTIVRGIERARDPRPVMESLKERGLALKHIRTLGLIESIYYNIVEYTYLLKTRKAVPAGERGNGRCDLPSRILTKIRESRRNLVGKAGIVTFTREVALLVRSGITMDRAMGLIAGSETGNPALTAIINGILSDIQKGHPIPQAFSSYPSVFNSEYTGLLQVGMETGKMADIMETLANDLEREYRLQKRVAAAIVYPAFVLSIAILSNLGIFFFVFPQVAEILSQMRLDLPLCTMIMINMIHLTGNPYFLLIVIVVSIFFMYQGKAYLNTPVGRHNFNWLLFNLPVFGSLKRSLFLEKFCRSLGMFYKHSVSTIVILRTVGGIFNNQYLNASLFDTIEKAVIGGEDLDVALKNNDFIPRLVSNLAAVGSTTGNFAGAFNRAAEFYELEIDQTIQRLVTLIEPVVVSILGFFILFTILSIFLPLYKVIASMGT